MSTVVTHLCEAMKEGLHVDVRRLGVTEKIENLITKAIWAPPINGGWYIKWLWLDVVMLVKFCLRLNRKHFI